jgi:PIN domain nuclease of toxin-antitoxin system
VVVGVAPWARFGVTAAVRTVTLLLDTHFLIWLVLQSKRLAKFNWLDRYRPWGVSPVSFLEIQFLAEVGRLSAKNPEFTNTVMNDNRFIVDDIPLETLVGHALRLAWTRDHLTDCLSATVPPAVSHFVRSNVAFATTIGLFRLSSTKYKYLDDESLRDPRWIECACS